MLSSRSSSNPAPRDRSSTEAERALERGQQLQHSEEVDLQVDVFMSRAVRNAMEHIDEKMDEWLDGNTPYFKHTWVVVGRAPAWRAVSNAVCECSTRRRWRSRVLGEPTNIERMYQEAGAPSTNTSTQRLRTFTCASQNPAKLVIRCRYGKLPTRGPWEVATRKASPRRGLAGPPRTLV